MKEIPDLTISIDVNRGYIPFNRVAKNVQGLISISVNQHGQTVKEIKEKKEKVRKKIVFLLDVSGSMWGNKLDTAKNAIIDLLNECDANDKIGLYTFSNDVNEIFPYEKLGNNKKSYIDRIKNLDTQGGTRMHGAMSELLEKLKKIDDNGRFIVVTDGEPTDISSVEPYRELSREIRESGFSVSAWGIGEEYNHELIINLAEYGAGTWRHIKESNPEMLKEAIDQETTETVIFYAPKLILKPAKGVKITDLKRKLPQVANVPLNPDPSGNIEVSLPAIVLDQPIVYSATFEITGKPDHGKDEEPFEFLEARIEGIKNPQSVKGNIIFTNDPELYGSETNPLVRIDNTVTNLISKTMHDPAALEKAKETATRIYEREGSLLEGTNIGKTVVSLTKAVNPDDIDEQRSLQDSLSRPL